MSQPQRMSITQALAELKLLRSRIESSYRGVQFVTLKTKRNDIDADNFSKRAKSAAQSFNDLMSRYSKIKSAIVVSNATVNVKVAGSEYTVAEAVERKRTVEFEKQFLQTLKAQLTQVKNTYDIEQRSLQERLDKLLMQELGKESKTNIDVVNSFTESFMRNNKVEMIDPLKLGDYIKERESEIESFLTNVDWVLSESNGVNYINV